MTFSAFGPAFAESVTVTDWQAWESLSDAEKANIAPYCGGSFVAPVVAVPADLPAQQTYFTFNQSVSDKELNHTLTGDVNIHSAQGTLAADEVFYSTTTRKGDLQGNVVMRTENEGISGNDAEVNLETYYSLIKEAQFVLYEQDIHGEANEMERTDQDTYKARQITFTRCVPSSNAWNIKASKLTVDNEEGMATAWNARIEVQNVPVLYTPYIAFPLDDRPRTGLLTPTFGSANSLPYYIHLAPNYDDTVTPIITADDGTVLDNEFRFLTENHSATNQIAYQVIDGEDSSDRWGVSHEQTGTLPGDISYDFSTKWVSDVYFDSTYYRGSDEVDEQELSFDLKKKLAGFNNTLAFDYTRPVDDSTEDFETYSTKLSTSKGIFSSTLLYETQEEYEETSDADADDYDYMRAPELALTFKPKTTLLGFSTQEKFRAGYFTRELSDAQIDDLSGDDLDYATNAYRAHGSLQLYRTYKADRGFYFKPNLEMFATGYDMSNDEGFDLEEEYGGSSVSQYAWRTSFDTGFNLISGINTVSPRLYYAYAPLTDQDGPILDSDESTSFNLFTASRFSGYDRVGDMSRLSGSLTYKYRPDSRDTDLFSATFSKGIMLAQERLTEDGVDDVDDDWSPEYSDWNLDLTYTPGTDWTFKASAEVYHDWDDFESYSASAHYNPSGNGFAYFEALREEEDDEDDEDYETVFDYLSAGFYLPVWQNIAVIGYASVEKEAEDIGLDQYQFSKLLYGLEYDNCCWSFRFATLETASDDDESNALYPTSTDTSYYVEVTLKGIGTDTGSSIESILNRLDFGYTGRLFNYQ
ncbi:LPS-assembly protein LptD [Reinekea marinisedimentorum]|uniref:LPS-assembly protein LptD n=1 Tax=Reinekea marinisedimentorum TaxID=230495 RepID=UPI0014044CA2|nr:LPS assembly protein LptD [Reinekea marinisedimentorum]